MGSRDGNRQKCFIILIKEYSDILGNMHVHFLAESYKTKLRRPSCLYTGLLDSLSIRTRNKASMALSNKIRLP